MPVDYNNKFIVTVLSLITNKFFYSAVSHFQHKNIDNPHLA